MKKLLYLFSMAVCFMLVCSPARAFELSETEDANHHKMWHKFKRGVINVLTSPVEIPKQIKSEVSSSDNKVLAGVGGTVKGLSYSVGRLGSGLWDMVSFNLAVPDNYESIMKPEYVCDKSQK